MSLMLLNAGPSAPGGDPGYLLLDYFQGANGTLLQDHTMDVGSGWTANAGTWSITGNAAYLSAGGASQGNASADAGSADVTMTVDVTTSDGGNFPDGGVVFRLSDNNNYWLWVFGTGIQHQLYERTAGSFTQRGTNGSNTPAAGNSYTAEVVTSGTSLVCTFGGVEVLNFTSSQHQASTKFGLRDNGSAPSSLRFDDFEVVA